MAAERGRVALYTDDESAWAYSKQIAKLLELDDKQLQFRKPLADQADQ